MTEWFFANGADRVGPVSAAQLRGLVKTGTVQRGTLVWKTGMQEWVEASRIKGLFLAEIELLPLELPPTIPRTAQVPVGNHAVTPTTGSSSRWSKVPRYLRFAAYVGGSLAAVFVVISVISAILTRSIPANTVDFESEEWIEGMRRIEERMEEVNRSMDDATVEQSSAAIADPPPISDVDDSLLSDPANVEFIRRFRLEVAKGIAWDFSKRLTDQEKQFIVETIIGYTRLYEKILIERGTAAEDPELVGPICQALISKIARAVSFELIKLQKSGSGSGTSQPSSSSTGSWSSSTSRSADRPSTPSSSSASSPPPERRKCQEYGCSDGKCRYCYGSGNDSRGGNEDCPLCENGTWKKGNASGSCKAAGCVRGTRCSRCHGDGLCQKCRGSNVE